MAPIEVSSNNTMIFPEVASLADSRTPSCAEIECQVANHSPNHHPGICGIRNVDATMLHADAMRTAPIWDGVSTPKFNMLPSPSPPPPCTDRNDQSVNDRVNHLYAESPSSDVEDGMDPRFPSPILPRKGNDTPYPMPLLAKRSPPPLPPMSLSQKQEHNSALRNGRGSPFPFRDSSSKKHVHISSADTLIPPSAVNAANIPLPMSPNNGRSASPSPPEILDRLTGTTLSAASSYTNSNGNIAHSRATLPPSYSAHSADPYIHRPALPLSNPVPVFPGGPSVFENPSIPSSTNPLLRTLQEHPRRQTPKLNSVPSYPALSAHGVGNAHPVRELHRLSSVKGKGKDRYEDTLPGSPSTNTPNEPRAFHFPQTIASPTELTSRLPFTHTLPLAQSPDNFTLIHVTRPPNLRPRGLYSRASTVAEEPGDRESRNTSLSPSLQNGEMSEGKTNELGTKNLIDCNPARARGVSMDEGNRRWVFDSQTNSPSREQAMQSRSVQRPYSGGVERSANSSQISLGSRGSRFNERFDLESVVVLAASDRTRELRAQRRRRRMGVMVGNEEVVVNVTEKGPEGEDEQLEENDTNGCTGIKGVKGIEMLKRKIEEWKDKVRAREWRGKVHAGVRKVLRKGPKEDMARNF